MVAITQQLAPDNSTDAAFRAWGSAVSDFMTSCGITKTADTGQINWATTLKPATGGAMAGYEIRQFTDALQNSNPVFIKIGYGSLRTISYPGIEITVGTGSNGSGTITGKVSPVTTIDLNSSSSILQTCVFSGSSNRVAIALFTSLSAAACFFSVERTKNASGEDTGDGILFFRAGITGKNNYFIPFIDLIPPAMLPGMFTPTGISTAVQSSDVNVYPNYFYNIFGKVFPPGINHLAYFKADVTAYTVKQLSIYGTSRAYYFLGDFQYIDAVARGAIANTCLAMLYE